MKIIFFGSDDFATTHLEALLQTSHQVVAVVTQPDSRQGRGMPMTISPIKAIATRYKITCLTPSNLKSAEIVSQLKSFQADLFVVVAYGKLLTQEILDIPKIFCINVHGSLLPKYRGAAPINWAILNGDRQTGVTIQKMVLSLDAGDIITQAKMDIPADMDAKQLRLEMAGRGATLLVTTVDALQSGQFTLTPQAEDQISYAAKLSKEMGRIDWSKNAQSIYNQIRGLTPWPGTYTNFKDKILKILRARIVDEKYEGAPGSVVHIDKNGFIVNCGQGALFITQVHLEASKPMPAASFVDGYLKKGDAYLF